ncbi:hypothetical protein WBK31_35175 [Nonomuraea sp. N2-4H]|uniref:hypothetical protein n=1 Tax=Nonomuraea sp. N2-4H TaxID=3128898 RepID=UPI00324DBF0E
MTLCWVLPLGIVAMLPIGVILGVVVRHPRQLSFVSLLLMGMTAISGIFYPLALQAPYLRLTGQLFPLYWLGLGMRSAMLPAELAATEIGGSWRPVETAAVLGLWAAAATALALLALRRMSHRAAGSRPRAAGHGRAARSPASRRPVIRPGCRRTMEGG